MSIILYQLSFEISDPIIKAYKYKLSAQNIFHIIMSNIYRKIEITPKIQKKKIL